MDVLPRRALSALADRLNRSPVVVVTGARQTGKSTLLRLRDEADRATLTLDAFSNLERARAHPDALFEPGRKYAVDEVQRAPELLLAVKRSVDDDRRPGRFILTGSANLLLMKGVAETLAGRTTHLALRPMTPRELRGDPQPSPWPELVAAPSAASATSAVRPVAARSDWRDLAVRGGLPPAARAVSADDRAAWFEGYLETYVQRDLRDLAQVADLVAFSRLVRLSALRTGGLVNFADLASDCGLPRTTVKRWMDLLETSYLLTVLPPWFASKPKRLIKTPKVYALDSGFALHLCGIGDATSLDESPHRGVWLEQLLLNDLLVWRDLELRKPGIFFYRTAGGEEIDFVVEAGRRILPIEVKASAFPRPSDAKNLEAFCSDHGEASPFGVLVYDGVETFRLTDRTVAVPISAVL